MPLSTEDSAEASQCLKTRPCTWGLEGHPATPWLLLFSLPGCPSPSHPGKSQLALQGSAHVPVQPTVTPVAHHSLLGTCDMNHTLSSLGLSLITDTGVLPEQRLGPGSSVRLRGAGGWAGRSWNSKPEAPCSAQGGHTAAPKGQSPGWMPGSVTPGPGFLASPLRGC